MSGEPTAGLVPGVPVPARPDPAPPDPAASGGTCRFGDGLAIGPDLEGAAYPRRRIAARLRALGLPEDGPGALSADTHAWLQAALRRVERLLERRWEGGTADAVCSSAVRGPRPGRGGVGGPLPGARLRLPARRGLPPRTARRAAVLLVDRVPARRFLPHTGALPVVGGLASARGGPVEPAVLDGQVHAHGAVGCSSAERRHRNGGEPGLPPDRAADDGHRAGWRIYRLAGAPALMQPRW